ncbi:MAG: DUF1501 domain-containing protein [Acidimicrobiia bacterium]|nr:DUF1501 domain-containing protein [Acidimicrobiia bacterium]
MSGLEGIAPPGDRRMSRRSFLAGLGTGATVAVGAGLGVTLWDRGRSDTAAPGTTTTSAGAAAGLGEGIPGRTLVVVELGGGNDGLNTLVPHADPAYRDLRPTLGVAEPLDLDGEVGLHPSLARLAERYRQGRVAIVEGIGYPDPDLSHFASMAVWWAASPDDPARAGWLGRYLDGTIGLDDPLAGIAIGPGRSAALAGDASFATSFGDASGLRPGLPAPARVVDEVLAAWAGFAPEEPDGGPIGRIQQAIGATASASLRLADALGAASAPEPGTRPAPGGLADAMELAGVVAVSDVAPRVVVVHGLGDFDTHQGQAQRHPALLAQLDEGIDRLWRSVEAAGRSDSVLVVTTSEFGRRAAENGSGTDHGTANVHFLVGPVAGGRHGEPPNLTRLDDTGNLRHTVDFRSLYATLLEGWLGVDPEAVLGGTFDPLPVLST